MNLTPAHLTLIDALAEIAVADYLTAQAAEQQGPAGDRTEPVPLPEWDRAA